MLSDDQAWQLLSHSVALPSPSGTERRLAEYLGGVAESLGARVHLDAVGNVHALFGRDDRAPRPMLMSHLDTVDTGRAAHRFTDDKIYGRGSVDAKGPLLAMLTACERVSDSLSTHWVGVVEEETIHSRGAEHLRATLQPPRYVIVGEPTGVHSVGIGYKGKADIVVTVRTAPTHSTSPKAHASELATAALSSLLATFPPSTRDQFEVLSFSVLDAHLGLHEATIQLGFRTPKDYSTDQLLSTVHHAFDFPHGEARIELTHSVSAALTARTETLPRHLGAAIYHATDKKPRFVRKTATCDMNTLAQSWDIPMVVYGPGDSDLDHADDEHIERRDFLTGVSILTTTLTSLK